MSNNKTRDIIREMADVLALLGDDYTLTGTECDPGDSAIRVIKRNSERTMYIIAYSNPADTEIRLYDEDSDLISQHAFYDGSFSTLSPETIAGLIIESLTRALEPIMKAKGENK